MAGVINDLKAHARILHRQVLASEPSALARVARRLAEFAGVDAATMRHSIRRRHCLAVLAAELGFRGWPDAVATLSGRSLPTHPVSSRPTAIKFIVRHGQIVSQVIVSMDTYDEAMMIASRDALSRLDDGPTTVSVALPDGTDVSLERKQRASLFRVHAGETKELYSLVSQASADLARFAGLYGAIGGTFGRDERAKPASERDMRITPERIQQFKEIAAQIVGSAPAFMCSGRLDGAASAFADCCALVLLAGPGR